MPKYPFRVYLHRFLRKSQKCLRVYTNSWFSIFHSDERRTNISKNTNFDTFHRFLDFYKTGIGSNLSSLRWLSSTHHYDPWKRIIVFEWAFLAILMLIISPHTDIMMWQTVRSILCNAHHDTHHTYTWLMRERSFALMRSGSLTHTFAWLMCERSFALMWCVANTYALMSSWLASYLLITHTYEDDGSYVLNADATALTNE